MKDNALEYAMLPLSDKVISFVKKRKESRRVRAAQKTTERERREKKTEKTGVTSY